MTRRYRSGDASGDGGAIRLHGLSSLSVQDTHRTEFLQISRAQRMRHVWHGHSLKRWNKTPIIQSSAAASRFA